MTDGALRLRMVEAAIRDEPGFVADDRELKRAGVSYTIDTLASFRAEFAGPLVVSAARHGCVPGVAAVAPLARAARRSRTSSSRTGPVGKRRRRGTLGELLRERRAPSAAELAAKPAGLVHVQPVTQLEISSTDLRDSLRAGRDPKFLVPDSVRQIILETECYAESL